MMVLGGKKGDIGRQREWRSEEKELSGKGEGGGGEKEAEKG